MEHEVISISSDEEDGPEPGSVSPSTTRIVGNILLRTKDLDRIRQGDWFNNDLVDAYLFSLTQQTDPTRFHVFSSFFYQQLTRHTTSMSRYKWRAFRTFLRNATTKDLIVFFPIILRAHWRLIYVRWGTRRCLLYTSPSPRD